MAEPGGPKTSVRVPPNDPANHLRATPSRVSRSSSVLRCSLAHKRYASFQHERARQVHLPVMRLARSLSVPIVSNRSKLDQEVLDVADLLLSLIVRKLVHEV